MDLQERKTVKPDRKVCFARGYDVELAAILHSDTKSKHVGRAQAGQAVVGADIHDGAEGQHVGASGVDGNHVALFVLLDVVPVQRVAIRRHVEESHADTLATA